MTRIEYDQLVQKLESIYENRGQALTRSAVGWAVLGYVVLITGLAGSIGLAITCASMIYMAPNALTIKLGGILGLSGVIIAFSILKGVWVHLSPPEGEVLQRQDVPALFEMIDSTAERAGGIHFNRVLLTDQLNASVCQVPLLGIFGCYRNYLTLGMPLLDALSPEEFHAVLAHEFAHLSRAHGRTGNWLYRIRSSWENVAVSLAEQGGTLVRPFHAFFDWFWPRFNARAFVLSRVNEYEADAFAASVTSPACASGALQRIAVEHRRLGEEVWGKLNVRSSREPFPPQSIYQEISSVFRTRIEPASCTRWLEQQLKMDTDTSDTHPSLRDRMSALGVPPEAAALAPIAVSAADHLLGPEFATATRSRLSQSWNEYHHADWTENHKACQEHREKIAELEAAPPSKENQWEILRLRCVLDGVGARLDDLTAWLATHPNDKVASYLVGCHLLSTDDSRGIDHLEELADSSPNDTMECLGQLADYHGRQGDTAAVQRLKQRADQHDVRMRQALAERNAITAKDTFEPHGLDADELATYREVIARQTEVESAWLVRKQTRLFSKWTSYILVVHLKFPTLKFASEAAVNRVLRALVNDIPVETYLLAVNDDGANKAATKVVKETPEALIYQKP